MQPTGFTFQISSLPTAVLIAITVAELLWLWSVFTVARQRTPDPSDRIVWLIIILFFNILGTIAFMFYYPWETIAPQQQQPQSSARSSKQSATQQEQANAPRTHE